MSTKSGRVCGLRRTRFGEFFSTLALGTLGSEVASENGERDELEFFST